MPNFAHALCAENPRNAVRVVLAGSGPSSMGLVLITAFSLTSSVPKYNGGYWTYQTEASFSSGEDYLILNAVAFSLGSSLVSFGAYSAKQVCAEYYITHRAIQDAPYPWGSARCFYNIPGFFWLGNSGWVWPEYRYSAWQWVTHS